jgi:hypothetical protein
MIKEVKIIMKKKWMKEDVVKNVVMGIVHVL